MKLKSLWLMWDGEERTGVSETLATGGSFIFGAYNRHGEKVGSGFGLIIKEFNLSSSRRAA